MAEHFDIDPTRPHAFLSYTRLDDKFLGGGISALREALELAVHAHTGVPFKIFQDVDDIKPGDAWEKKLDRAIQAAQLFIPILTPTFFTSKFCRNEAAAFLNYEKRAGRDDLVLPIYLIRSSMLEDEPQRTADDIASRLHERQYADWRHLRHKLQHDECRSSIDELAGAIARAIVRSRTITPAPTPRGQKPPEKRQVFKGKIGKSKEGEETFRVDAERLLQQLVDLDGSGAVRQIEDVRFKAHAISMVFEIAFRSFSALHRDSVNHYENFLNELGDELGFLYARRLISKIEKKYDSLDILGFETIISLWAKYFDEEFHVKTTVDFFKKSDIERLEITLEGNPLRHIESEPHLHCRFFRSFIRSSINEFYFCRSRKYLGEKKKIHAHYAKDVLEDDVQRDKCIFSADLQREKQSQAFDKLYSSFDAFFSEVGENNYISSIALARSAVVAAQINFLKLEDNRIGRFYKIFDDLLPKRFGQIMRDFYHIASKHIHSERKDRVVTRQECYKMLQDARRCIYAIEFLEIEDNDLEERKRNILKQQRDSSTL